MDKTIKQTAWTILLFIAVSKGNSFSYAIASCDAHGWHVVGDILKEEEKKTNNKQNTDYSSTEQGIEHTLRLIAVSFGF